MERLTDNQKIEALQRLNPKLLRDEAAKLLGVKPKPFDLVADDLKEAADAWNSFAGK